MLTIVIEGSEYFDDETQKFIEADDGVVFELEHSLVSLSKWESEFQRPFLAQGDKSSEEILAYLKYMMVTPGIDPDVLLRLSKKEIDQIQAYIDSSQSATTFGSMPERRGLGETITAELIYYWMVAFTIPWEAQYWHLNRLFALIRICNIKNSDPKKQQRNTREAAEERRRLNEQRRKELNSKG